MTILPEDVWSAMTKGSEIVRNLAIGVGIVVGGIWAFLRWRNPGRADPRANSQSLEGDLSIESYRLGTDSLFVSVRGLWINRGEFTVALNPKECRVFVYRLSEALPHGRLPVEQLLGHHLFEQRPFEDDKRLEMEPKTESKLRAHFVLQPGPVYLFRWQMKSLNSDYTWRKDIGWKCS